jgi:hypothetical protein
MLRGKIQKVPGPGKPRFQYPISPWYLLYLSWWSCAGKYACTTGSSQDLIHHEFGSFFLQYKNRLLYCNMRSRLLCPPLLCENELQTATLFGWYALPLETTPVGFSCLFGGTEFGSCSSLVAPIHFVYKSLVFDFCLTPARTCLKRRTHLLRTSLQNWSSNILVKGASSRLWERYLTYFSGYYRAVQ